MKSHAPFGYTAFTDNCCAHATVPVGDTNGSSAGPTMLLSMQTMQTPVADAPDAKQEMVQQQARYMQRVVEEVHMVIADPRRQSVHNLVLNYLAAGGGIQALKQQFQAACELLWRAARSDSSSAQGTSTTAAIETGEQHAQNLASVACLVTMHVALALLYVSTKMCILYK